MSVTDTIRAWKDKSYRNSLSAEQKAAMPENPAGLVELPEDVVQSVSGGGKAFQLIQAPTAFFSGSWLCNCKGISNAMSATSTCCCYR